MNLRAQIPSGSVGQGMESSRVQALGHWSFRSDQPAFSQEMMMAMDSLVFFQGPLNPTAKGSNLEAAAAAVLIFNPQNSKIRGSLLQPQAGTAKLHIESVDIPLGTKEYHFTAAA
ncbi:hypothetical protein CRENBAI_021149 [Crenichthys baileyi]|uniref:Uncharacterized protein n=1 Tax=Crenichthys baileyi TaxID=28760 RepID=A0AAV9QW93_9TELE